MQRKRIYQKEERAVETTQGPFWVDSSDLGAIRGSVGWPVHSALVPSPLVSLQTKAGTDFSYFS